MDWGGLGEMTEVKQSMVRKLAAFCNSDQMRAIKERVSEVILVGTSETDGPPGQVLEYQYEILCMMKGMERNMNRGGLLANEAGTGKTMMAMLHTRMNCSTSGTIIVFAPITLIEDVWEPQCKAWLRDSRCFVLESADKMRTAPSTRDWGGYIMLVSKDAFARTNEDTLTQLKKLKPEYIIVDEGTEMGSSTATAEKIGKLQWEFSSFTWVISATPFKMGGESFGLDRKDFTKVGPKYCAITQRQNPHPANRPIEEPYRKMKSALEQDRYNFVIAMSQARIREHLPRYIPCLKELPVRGNENPADLHKRIFLRGLREAKRAGLKVVVAGIPASQRFEIKGWLDRAGIKATCTESDGNSVLQRFATDDVSVCLLHKTLLKGADSLKVAHKVVFWDKTHEEFTNLQLRTSVIKRVCRLGCPHKVVFVEHYTVTVLSPSRSRSPRR